MALARYGSAEAATLAIASSRHVVTLDLVNQRLAPSPMEPRAIVATYDAPSDRLTLRVSSQTPTGVRDKLCEVLDIATDTRARDRRRRGRRLRHEDDALRRGRRGRVRRAHAATAREVGGRSHGGLPLGLARPRPRSCATLALDEEGRILALRVESLANLGAYATPAGAAIQLLIGPWVSTSVYDIPIVDIRITGVLTNTAPTGPYRGAGRPEAIFTIERLIDAAARKCGLDRVALRRRNLVKPVQMPYRNAMGKTYDTGQFERVLDLALAHAEWDGYAARAADSAARGRLRGRGIVTFLEWTGAEAFEERVDA